ncbi:MAG: cytochrome C assembly family protein [Myxococcaceae bacterium]
MTRALLSIVCHLYGAAAVVYLTYLVRQWRALALAGRILVAAGLVVHGVAIASWLTEQGRTVGIAQGFSVVAFLLLAIFLVMDLTYRAPVLGAFLTPMAVTVVTAGLFMHDPEDPLPLSLRQPLLPVHISIALLGMAAFAVAAAVGVMYLLLERQMKGKKFGVLFSRLPPLQFLDELNRRLVVWGFIALSVTLVTGVFFASGGSGLFWRWGSREVATLVAWGLFAVLLNFRFFAGWQGKRAAVLTMAGFGLLLISFFSYTTPTRSLGGFN